MDKFTTGNFGANKDWIDNVFNVEFRKDLVTNKRKLLFVDLTVIREMCIYFKGNGWTDKQSLFLLCFGNGSPTKANVDLLKSLFNLLAHKDVERDRLPHQVMLEIFSLPSFRHLSNKLSDDNNAAMLEANLLWIRDIFGPNGVVSLLKHFDKPKILLKDLTVIQEMCVCLIEDGSSDTEQLFQLCFGNERDSGPWKESEIEALNKAIQDQGDEATVSSIAAAIPNRNYRQVWDWLNYHRPEYLAKLRERHGWNDADIEALNTAIQDQGDEATVSSIATAIDRDNKQVWDWLNYHRPEYLAKLRERHGHRKWTSEENNIIRDAYPVYGNKYETIINKCFPGLDITSEQLRSHIAYLKKKALANGNTEWWQHTTKPDDVAEISKSSNEEVVQICTCKKSQCLKLYCQCFASGGLCGTMCQCVSCKNNTECDEQLRKAAIKNILSRNPKAFDKYSAVPVSAQEERDDSIPVKTHTYSCKCRKSACLKKYCECYNASQKCNPTCGCLNCKNMPDSDSMTAKEGSFVVPPNEGLPIKKRPFNQISNASDSDQADSEGVMLVDENSEEDLTDDCATIDSVVIPKPS